MLRRGGAAALVGLGSETVTKLDTKGEANAAVA
jgi:hypothetical protein